MSDPDPMTASGSSDSASGSMSVAEVTGLISIFAGMLNTMQANIIGRLDDNSRAASERWARHDQDLDRNREAVVTRFLKVEGSLETQGKVLSNHLERQHDADVRLKARVQPIRTILGLTVKNWRTILLFIFAVLAVAAAAPDALHRILGI
jgi:anti-sigma-K factor RskA